MANEIMPEVKLKSPLLAHTSFSSFDKYAVELATLNDTEIALAFHPSRRTVAKPFVPSP